MLKYKYPIFLSIVLVRNSIFSDLEAQLLFLTSIFSKLVSDYEIIIIDNTSGLGEIYPYNSLTGENGIPNLQVFVLTKCVDVDTCCWVGLENSLGDYVAVIDLDLDDAKFLPSMLEDALQGFDVVFAKNTETVHQNFFYQIFSTSFNALYKYCSGVYLSDDAPHYRLLSRSVVNFILQHPQPDIAYRHLPATGGFSKIKLAYSSATPCGGATKKNLLESIDRGLRLLASTSKAPMRIVTFLTLFGALSNLFYSAYVLVVGLFKDNVAPGWISLSLQQSGMFFLISLVLFVLCEYILNYSIVGNEGPAYHVAREFTSARMTRRDKLNVEVVTSSSAGTNFSNKVDI